jgi:hypothetical protein
MDWNGRHVRGIGGVLNFQLEIEAEIETAAGL